MLAYLLQFRATRLWLQCSFVTSIIVRRLWGNSSQVGGFIAGPVSGSIVGHWMRDGYKMHLSGEQYFFAGAGIETKRNASINTLVSYAKKGLHCLASVFLRLTASSPAQGTALVVWYKQTTPLASKVLR